MVAKTVWLEFKDLVYVRKKNDLPVPRTHERDMYGAEICKGGV